MLPWGRLSSLPQKKMPSSSRPMSITNHDPETIVAVSTPRGYSGIGVIRISGPESLQILRKVLPSIRTRLPIPESERGARQVIDPDTEKAYDDGLAIFMKGPNSYTGEDVVELCLHGNPLILDTAVKWAIRCGHGRQAGVNLPVEPSWPVS